MFFISITTKDTNALDKSTHVSEASSLISIVVNVHHFRVIIIETPLCVVLFFTQILGSNRLEFIY